MEEEPPYFYGMPICLSRLYPCSWCDGTGSVVCECRGGSLATRENRLPRSNPKWHKLFPPKQDCPECYGVKSTRFSCSSCDGSGNHGIEKEEIAFERKKAATKLRALAAQIEGLVSIAKSRSETSGGHGYAKFIPPLWREELLNWAEELERPIEKWNSKTWYSIRIKRDIYGLNEKKS